MPWEPDVVHGFTEVNDQMLDVTMKEKVNDAGATTDVLLAPGHVPDIQPGVDHVHAWDQNEATADHHDLREGPPMFPM